jgi:hypothetical protein
MAANILNAYIHLRGIQTGHRNAQNSSNEALYR